MKVQFKKKRERHIIAYQREGMNEQWIEADAFLVLHDLSHYAVEKTLGYQQAFWGLVKSGAHHRDFEQRETRKKLLVSDEAWYAESLANLFLMERAQGIFDDFNKVLEETLQTTLPQIPPMSLSAGQLSAIRTFYNDLVDQWKGLEEDGILTLVF